MSKKKHKKKGKKKTSLNKKALIQNIIEIFDLNPEKSYNYKQISSRLLIKESTEKQLVNEVLRELATQEILDEIYTGKYRLKSKTGYITGTVEITKGGYGFIVTEEIEDDIFVSQNNLHHALNGDTVKVYLYAQRKGRNTEGEVIEIIERKRTSFVGIIEITRNFAFLITEGRDMPYDLFIPLENLNGAKNGQKAIGKITDWPKKAKNPFGEIIEILGNPGDNDVEMHAILAEFELPNNFNREIEDEANKLDDFIPKDEYKNRKDFRKIKTFTIDPADAKDFDDALSFKILKNGNTEVGIHIADVTHYIKPNTLLDNEAFNRATSVYLVDRVVPMLPETLSNKLCSLRPKEEKLCYSAVFELDENADIIKEWFGKTVIFSDKRFTYEEAQEIIENGKGELKNEILKLHNLAQKLRKRRFSKGSIAFDRIEVKFNIDEKGNPLGVYFKEQKESNQLIEEFMLLANKRVAEFVNAKKEGKRKNPFVYRIHDKPNRDKFESFSNFIKKFGYTVQSSSPKKISESLNNLLKNIKGKKEQNLIENIALRSMAKAIYSTKNIGHYGLGFENYTHFTSPIRRYPDMMVHRLLDEFMDGKTGIEKNVLEKKCMHASEMERRAVDAERASIKYKQVEFMMDKIGKIYDGVISGVTEWGLFVELIENKCEGFIPINELKDDYYIYDEEEYRLRGRSFDKKYQLGDELKIIIWRTNLAKRQLDFKIAE